MLPYTISKLSAKYQFCAIHTADTTHGKVTNRALLSTESEKVHRLYLFINIIVLCNLCFVFFMYAVFLLEVKYFHGLFR